MNILLVSTYDLGRQSFGLASPAAWLREHGADVACADLSQERLSDDQVRHADVVAFFLPMHTATRLALPLIERVRALNPAARLCAYGLYAPLNAAWLRERGITDILGGEFEEGLVRVVESAARRDSAPPIDPPADLPRLRFRVPDRQGLVPLSRYASIDIGGERRVVGYTEASRGCKHTCRHCPVVPVYNGRFRVVPVDGVLADIRAQVAAGAAHITFGDPDFFNGITHATAVVEALAREWPGLSYDVTIKIEHLLRHASALSTLRATGCVSITSAVESIEDDVLNKLQKGHTAADFEEAVARCRDAGVALSPTFVAFTPWTTRAGYCRLLQTVDRLGLVDSVAPVQLAIRLLITHGSRLLELDEIERSVGPFNPERLVYPWTHADPAVDRLQETIEALAGSIPASSRRELFGAIWDEAHRVADLAPPPRLAVAPGGLLPPSLSEPWYCCAEPQSLPKSAM